MENTEEQRAHDRILTRCRRESWAMREAPANPLHGCDWPTRYQVQSACNVGCGSVIAEGDTWCAVENKLAERADGGS